MVNTGIKMTNAGDFLKVYIVDVEREEMGVQDMPNTLRDMKRLTCANCIEISDVTILGQPFKAIYSAKVNGSQHISCVDEKGKSVYRGNVIIVASEKDRYGNEILTDLTDDEVQLLMSNTGLMYIEGKDGGAAYNAYVLCNLIEVKE